MKRYEDMTRDEIKDAINRGATPQLNDAVARFLDGMQLSDKARTIINETPINFMAESFGGCMTAEEVEALISEYPDED